ncbi:3-phosphoshikimate 1-carboxyvinyltransferase [Lamprobacter modestohalophilus]|uniref:3-phosphoshikimate 1-carboxyvinyltransferase n=1 Tax=Lamprobacter modestohalophilus TaxID=1064514 RepID=A0A9X0WBI6_9GAMM|nr:3-phosphoshikimate 1-carboxyvinyltransferase [Lamprobacter modestohalophilus]MBK1620120.1 3-phosphoshikimate 1-carboxyvinyltransferase [Lamprobacter modestohalophilus]
MTASAHSLSFELAPGGALRGELRVPGDKSISHRAVMLAALAEGETEIEGFLEGADSLATLAAFRAMGVEAEGPAAGRLRVSGVGLQGLREPQQALDLGNSGTSMRLLSGLLAGQRFASTLIGDASLSRRPMGRVIDPLTQMGARIEATPEGRSPLRVLPAEALVGIDYALPVASAQVKSSLLLAGLYAQGETCVTEPAPTRDHTERMLGAFGYPVRRQGNRVCLSGGGRLVATPIRIPADISSAAFFLVGASIAPGSDLTLTEVGMNPTRIGVVNILRQMGADIAIERPRELGGEPVADLRVRAAALHGIAIPEDQVPLAIDEFPALFIAAACADGETLLSGAAELRVKESDRIQVMADGLSALGVEVEPRADGMLIRGIGAAGLLGGGRVAGHGDHRIAMAFAISALRATAPIQVDDCANVETSFPRFAGLAAGVGLQITERRAEERAEERG